jgi:predicted nucleic acid-binding protein
MDAADVDAALGDTHRAFIDTSTCIAYFSTAEAAHAVARHLFDRIADDADPLIAYLSIVSVSEMLVRPIRAGQPRLGLVHQFIQTYPNLQILPADFEVALQAANIRALTRLALPDALLVGTALLSGCEAVITNDERWSRRLAPLYPQFRWISLGR